MTSFTELPEELVTKVLLRVHFEDILKCKRVCKDWAATIRSPSFTSSWSNEQGKRPWLLVLRRWCAERKRLFVDYRDRDHQLWYHKDDSVRLRFEFPPFHVLGYCPEGLACVCLMDKDFKPDRKQLAICNISTRKIKKLPRLVAEACDANVVVCKEDKSYKVAVHIEDPEFFLSYHGKLPFPNIAIYDSKIQHWVLTTPSAALKDIFETSFVSDFCEEAVYLVSYTWEQEVFSEFHVPCPQHPLPDPPHPENIQHFWGEPVTKLEDRVEWCTSQRPRFEYRHLYFLGCNMFHFRGRTMFGFVEWTVNNQDSILPDKCCVENPRRFVIQELLSGGRLSWLWKQVASIDIATTYGAEMCATLCHPTCYPVFTVVGNCVIISAGPESEKSVIPVSGIGKESPGVWPPLCYNMDDGSCRLMVRPEARFILSHYILATFTPDIGLMEDVRNEGPLWHNLCADLEDPNDIAQTVEELRENSKGKLCMNQ